jgi:hypothetical protein
VLDCVHGVFTAAELGAPLAGADFAHVRTNARQADAVRSTKNDSLPCCRWLKRDCARDAEVQSNPL